MSKSPGRNLNGGWFSGEQRQSSAVRVASKINQYVDLIVSNETGGVIVGEFLNVSPDSALLKSFGLSIGFGIYWEGGVEVGLDGGGVV
jgi:hypothetical protein